MDNAFRMISDIVTSLTGIVVGLVGLGVVGGVVFGDMAFVGDVLGNLVGLVSQLGDAGVVGLIAAAILLNLLK